VGSRSFSLQPHPRFPTGAPADTARAGCTEIGEEPLFKAERKTEGSGLYQVIGSKVPKEFARLLRKPFNFFKHADSDPDGVLVFRPAQTEAILLDSGEMYRILTGRLHRAASLFAVWLAVHDPELFFAEGVLSQMGAELRARFGAGAVEKAVIRECLKDRPVYLPEAD
jgi:hypothetical protein